MSVEEDRLTEKQIESTPEIKVLLNHAKNLHLAEGVPLKMSTLLQNTIKKICEKRNEILASGREILICGPDWCRENSVSASVAHAKVIIETYGNTYALPNKNPENNKKDLDNGVLDMFLIFNKNGMEPIGTACMVLGDGWAELGRAASFGHVGNRLIQDLRILRWLTNPELSNRFHSLFATLRTAPDRDIGTIEEPLIMRGGQAVSHIWSKTPNVVVAGFGPLYKKHDALEQFSFAVISQKEYITPDLLWIANEPDQEFVKSWLDYYGLKSPPNIAAVRTSLKSNDFTVKVNFPPTHTGITKFVHGEINLVGNGLGVNIVEGIRTLESSGVPFIQFPVPLDSDTTAIQYLLRDRGFHAFQFLPGLKDIQPPLLWFGKTNGDIPIIPTFWQSDQNSHNPFWKSSLAKHGNRISQTWSNL